MTRRRALVWVVAALTVAVLAETLPAAAQAQGRPRPLVFQHSLADPSVARVGPRKLVAVATGGPIRRRVSADGRTWRPISTPLLRRPRWAQRTGSIWASEIVQVGRRWLLYFAAPVRGRRAHCLGVAVSPSATGRFTPVRGKPLVCPARGIGVIDPSVYVRGHRPYLLYKTDGKPSAIRLVRLTRAGTHRSGRSHVLVRSRGVIENPVLLKRGRYFYLLTSVGGYGTCGYATTVRRSRSLTQGRGHPARRLLSQRGTGLCGPGGADVVTSRHRVTLYFHAWVCRGSASCHTHPRRRAGRVPVRALYAVRLRFRHGWPVRAGYIRR